MKRHVVPLAAFGHTSPTHVELVLRLRAIVKEALDSGVPREEVMADLQTLKVDFQGADADRGDVVLNVMDFIEGWASPHVSLRHIEHGTHASPVPGAARRAPSRGTPPR